MDFYITTLGLGVVGMIAMAFSGSSRGGARGGHGATAHGATGHGHAAHAGSGGRGGHSGKLPSGKASQQNLLLSLMSPKLLFSVCVGLGAGGLLLRPLLGNGVILFGTALAIGIVFERALVTPIWNFAFRFALEPALSLESVLSGEATAVTAFDASGHGLIAVEVDGRLVQMLGTLQAVDRELHAKVVAGAKLRIEEVDEKRNRCTVSLR
ncbi:MAG: hypothetical protein ACREN6_15545 [Gemmatimonadaceae bacterium]